MTNSSVTIPIGYLLSKGRFALFSSFQAMLYKNFKKILPETGRVAPCFRLLLFMERGDFE